MENKIVYMKTYLFTIIALVVVFAVAIGGCIYYYEGKLAKIQKTLDQIDRLTVVETNVTTEE